MSDFEPQALKFKTTFRATINFKEWRKQPITRKAALKTAWRALRERNWVYAGQMLRAAWRGYTSGTLYNPAA